MVHGVVWHAMGHDVEGIGKGVMEDSTILMIYGGGHALLCYVDHLDRETSVILMGLEFICGDKIVFYRFM